MKTIRLYGLKNCDKCRKAARELRNFGQNVEYVDVRATPPADADYQRFYRKFGEKLVNRRSTTWREIPDHEKTDAALELLPRHPSLMKRPVIDAGGALFLGWDENVRASLIG